MLGKRLLPSTKNAFINIHPLYIIFSSDSLNYKQNGTKQNIVFQVC